MLIATQSNSVRGTQIYYESVLTQGDYYLGQEIAGHWHGKGADLLGLGQGAKVTKEQFVDLLKGYHPETGHKLTQRIRKDRRPGVDLTFSVPKSVSLAWAIREDENILEFLREATHETMREDVEPLMQRRLRSGKYAKTKDRVETGKLIYADFLHKTSRPVDGVPDPHLHIHAFVMNWTEEAGKHYAGEFEEIIRQRASLQAKFESRLAVKLNEAGYTVQQVEYQQSGITKQGWELKGIDRSTIEKFSRRTAQVEEYAKANGIRDAEEKGKIGKLTREKKENGKSIAELRKTWQQRLTEKERTQFKKLTISNSQKNRENESERATKSVQYALDHHLYRQSTVERHQLIKTALEHAVNLKPQAIEKAAKSLNLIEREVKINGVKRHLVTTRSVLKAERDMIGYARSGRGTRKAIQTKEHECSREWLNDHQKRAVEHVLSSRDSVIAIAGGAGTGKTSLMQEAVEAIEKNKKQVFTFAPSTGAKEVLEGKGFKKSETVEHLIRNTKLQSQLKNQLIWVDEAGLVDVRSMNKVFKIAKEQNARVVLSGDTRQHASPRRGEALSLLENEAGLKVARSELIQRQKGKYRKAVLLVSKGLEIIDERSGKTGLMAGFEMLDAMGKIKEIQSKDRYSQLAKTYLKSNEQGKSTLVIAPTHAEAGAATSEIRHQLKSKGKLATEEKEFTQYRSLNLSDAQKQETKSYQKEDNLIIQFHQNCQGGIKRGDRYEVVNVADGKVELRHTKSKLRRTLPLDSTDRFEIYRENKLRFAVGDKIRFSLGGTSKDGKGRISNGRLDEIKSFDRQGNIVLKNGWVVSKNYAHFDLGYVVTSHASQGKDRDIAIAAMGSHSLPAINARQFYVTVSRGKEDVLLYVDNKAKVRDAIQRSGKQLSASELIKASNETKKQSSKDRTSSLQEKRSRSFRDRIQKWWRSMTEGRTVRPAQSRPQVNIGKSFGFGMTPSLGRSRG